jgi:hypothetical protein
MTRPPDDDEVVTAIAIPKAVFWGLIVPMLGAICGGSVYMGQLSMTVANQGLRLTAAENRVDTNNDKMTAVSGGMNDRLIRMEAQLGYLVQTSNKK